ncbi:MAG: hypothetical protein IRZ18_07025, partial [Clostridia bacterium]|nr:hypothetical protein [Clostridia bacterium]
AREALDGRAAGVPALRAGADAPAGDGPGARWSRLFEGMRHALRGRRSPAPDVPAPGAGGPPAAGRGAIADPRDVDVVAPSRPARPLVDWDRGSIWRPEPRDD